MRRKMLIVGILILSMLLQLLVPFTTVRAAENVEITLNSKLYYKVKENLTSQRIAAQYNDASGKIVISESELARVRSLDLSNSEIDDLTGLEAFKNVTNLDLHANELDKDTSLEALSQMNLVTLDLSSNKLESIKSLGDNSGIAGLDITNQKVTGREIIEVDTSEEATGRSKTVEVELPDILLEDGNRIKPSWVTKVNYKFNDKGPEVDFEHSFANGSTVLSIKVAEGEGTNYKALKGLVRVDIKIKDSKSKLNNTEMSFYYAVVDDTETGIAFDDENLYKAVKKQLSNNQKINEEITATSGKNLYTREYDEALIMVINDDDIVNNIPSLVLHDQQIKDLRGLEKFVGLKSNLDISYNYIDSVSRVVELEQNKIAEEENTRNKYQTILEELKTNITEYDKQMGIAKEASDNYEKAKKELEKISEPEAQASKRNQMQEYKDEENKAIESVKRSENLINKYVEKLYNIYKKEYLLMSLLPIDVNKLTYEELIESDKETSQNYVNSIIERVSNFEKNGGLTKYEDEAIRALLTKWGQDNGIEFRTEKKQSIVQDNGEVSDSNVPIDYPITEFLETVKSDKTLELVDYQQFVFIFKGIDVLSKIQNYCLIKNVFESNTSDLSSKAIAELKEVYEEKDLDTFWLDKLETYTGSSFSSDITVKTFENGTDGVGLKIENSLYNFKIAMPQKAYSGTLTGIESNYKMIIAHKLSLISGDEIQEYIYLSRVKVLDMDDNWVRDFEGLTALTELRELYAYKNLLTDISNIDWGSFTRLTKLGLGYNQISDIKPLEVLTKLQELDVKKNLLSGTFDFSLINMTDLQSADFSENQYSDISYASEQYVLKAMSYDHDGDGFTDDYSVPEYLKAVGINLSFRYQTLETYLKVIKTGDEFFQVTLPLIFKQLEELDHENTSFGIDSLGGIVEPLGTFAQIKVPEKTGDYVATVMVEGRNGSDEIEFNGIGYGTICKIHYEVLNGSSGTLPSTPDTPLTYGYNVEDDYILVYKPKTKLNEFAETLVDLNNYKVTVTENDSKENIETGSVVTVSNRSENQVLGILETVVKGDVNGDGEVDALDSGIVRQVINDTRALLGVYNSAADVNHDGEVDSQDALLILKYRADRIVSFER